MHLAKVNNADTRLQKDEHQVRKAKSMAPKQIDNLINHSPQERYDYFLRNCADLEQVWGLVVGEDNWVIFKDADGDEVFPVWPHSELAEVCCFEEHRKMGAMPQAIKLTSFIENCVPDMIADHIYFGVFFDNEGEGLAIDGGALKAELEAEVASLRD